jgi:penicillin-insensitive murein endopeptidase
MGIHAPSFGIRLRRVARVVGACGIALACCALASERGAALDDTRPEGAPPLPSASVSTGFPWLGKLLDGVPLHMGETLRPVTEYAEPGNFYGTAELVAMLERAAQEIAARWPGTQLSVGELSGPQGGKLSGHRSHRNGRDVDVAFFMHDADGQMAPMDGFVTCRRNGSAHGLGHTFYFDDAKNWALVAALLRAPEARVQYMFVSKRIRARLLDEGRRQGESEDLLNMASFVMVEPKRGHKHANHFHVRVYCAQDDRPQCRDSAPYWPWYDDAPRF